MCCAGVVVRNCPPRCIAGSDQLLSASLAFDRRVTSYANAPKVVNEYDELGRLTRVQYPDGAMELLAYGVDTSGTFPRAYVDQTKAQYGSESTPALPTRRYLDGLGRTYLVTEYTNEGSCELGCNTEFTYNSLDNLLMVVNALGEYWDFYYDSLGQNTSFKDPDLGDKTFSYDAAGNLISEYHASNRLDYTYDALNRLTQKRAVASGVADAITRYDYDTASGWNDPNAPSEFGASIGRLLRVVYPGGLGSEYHAWNLLGQETLTRRCVDLLCEDNGFQYDAGRRLASLTYADAAGAGASTETVQYVYDADGNPERIPGYISAMNFNARGQVTQMSYANGASAAYQYADSGPTGRGWLASVSLTGPSGALYHAGYTYTADAQIATVRSQTNERLNLSFVYDNLVRLVSAVPQPYGRAGGGNHPETTEHSYVYDAAGNIVSNSKLSNGAAYSYGRMYGAPSAPYHAVKWVDSHFYEYDARGNLKLAYENSGCAVSNTKVFLWDTENRLKQVTFGSVGVKFAYDAAGDRIKKASSAAAGGATTRFFGRYAEIESKGTTRTRTRFVYLGSQLVAKKTQALDASGAATGTADTVWFHADHLTSTRLMTDASGAKVAHYDYAIFGEKTHESGTKAAANQKGFTSHEHDDELGLIYMKARYYDPVLGRFISPDSIIPEPGDPQSWNRYAYVRNNPFNAVDPTGHFDILGVTNVGTRALGALQVAGGASESALGGMVAAGGSATGVGDLPPNFRTGGHAALLFEPLGCEMAASRVRRCRLQSIPSRSYSIDVFRPRAESFRRFSFC